MFVSLKKKKNIIVLSICIIISYILYQLYFFLRITAESTARMKLEPVFDMDKIEKVIHVRSNDDKFINEHGAIRGVLRQQMPWYRPNKENKFKCIYSDQVIPFEYVNDDFCDCEDESDEPSTNACPNGVFHCDMQHQKAVYVNSVPSSQVNDGICDCCDGTDEWLHKTVLSQPTSRHYRHYLKKCSNICDL